MCRAIGILSLVSLLLWGVESCSQGAMASDDPLKPWNQKWTSKIQWDQVVDITSVKGSSLEERIEAAQQRLSHRGGGVVHFPRGEYRLQHSIKLRNGIVLRGESPVKTKDAREAAYRLSTRFIFPRYQPKLSGNGTPIREAFQGIQLDKPGTASNCGLLNLAIDNGHVDLGDDGTKAHRAGKHRFVVGCILTNAAVADPSVPDLTLGQHPWQRFTHRHHAAVHVKGENLLIANNRLPQSGEANFTMKGYIVKGKGREKKVTLDEVVFDYDNRPGLYINDYGIGAAGGSAADDGTPEKYPWGFRKGIVITNNYVFCTGRCAIAFCGDGVLCSDNVIRFKKDVYRPTTTGRNLTTGSSTNDNRAVQMRGWRWTVEGNVYEVYRNLCSDRSYYINDGEGLMHEDHVNSTIRDSKLIGNKGNSYLTTQDNKLPALER